MRTAIPLILFTLAFSSPLAAEVVLETVQPLEDGNGVRIEGRAELPEGAELDVVLEQSGRIGLLGRTVVRQGRFQLVLGPTQKLILPGPYQVVVEAPHHPAAGSAQKTVMLGDAAAGPSLERRLRAYYQRSLTALRLSYLTTVQWGDFLRQQPDRLERQQLMDLSHRRRLLDAAGDIRTTLRARSTELGLDVLELRRTTLITPLPELEDGVIALRDRLRELQDAYHLAILRELGEQPPAALIERPPARPEELEPRILDEAEQLYRLLGDPMTGWELDAIRQLERPASQSTDDQYVSGVLPFSVPVPAGWQVRVSYDNPMVRIRVVPEAEEARGRVAALIEIQVLPAASSPEEMGQLIEVNAWERWLSYRRLGGGLSEATPEGHPVHRLHFRYDDVAGQELEVWQRTVLDVPGQTSYAVLATAAPPLWDRYGDDLRQILDGFRITGGE